jgi:hypothetical protein
MALPIRILDRKRAIDFFCLIKRAFFFSIMILQIFKKYIFFYIFSAYFAILRCEYHQRSYLAVATQANNRHEMADIKTSLTMNNTSHRSVIAAMKKPFEKLNATKNTKLDKENLKKNGEYKVLQANLNNDTKNQKI